MIRIKISSCCPQWNWLRQSPHSKGIWNNCQFIFDKEIKECDYFIVYENIKKQESILCPQQNTILITGEPPSTQQYHPKFISQFSTIITCHTKLEHKNVILSHQSLPWMIGYKNTQTKFTKSYDELTKIKNYNKTKLISIICSNKVITKSHKQRLIFVDKLKTYFGDKIDFYGRNTNPIEDKWDVIEPYKYHIALENCSIDNYWTEKIADSFLGQSYPIYYGCKNIEKYFPTNSLTTIDIFEPEQACKIIEQTIKENKYEKSITELQQAKYLVLNTHNIFPRMAKICQKAELEKSKMTFYPQEYFDKKNLIIRKVKSFFSLNVKKK
jgi:hypothetical protein